MPRYIPKPVALEILCEALQPGTEIYSVRKHVNRTHTNCELEFYTVRANRVYSITALMQAVLPYKPTKRGHIKVHGWGRDAGWQVVQALSFALHGLVGKGRGMEPNAPCDVTDAINYRAGHSLAWKEL